MSNYKKWLRKLEKRQQQKDGVQSTSSKQPMVSMAIEDQMTKALPDLPPLIFLSSIEDIILNDWIDINVTGDKSKIVVSGTPTDQELDEAWMILQSQFMTISDKQGAEVYMNEISDVELIKMRINDIKFLLSGLQISYDERIIQQLRNWEIYEPLTPDSYLKDITKIENRLKSDEMRVLIAKNNKKEPIAGKEGVPQTRENYLKILLQIGEMRKMHYTPRQINTLEYAIMYGELREYHNLLKKQSHGNK